MTKSNDDYDQLQKELSNVASSFGGLFNSVYDITSRRFDDFIGEHSEFDRFWNDKYQFPSFFEKHSFHDVPYPWSEFEKGFFPRFGSPFGYFSRRKPSLRSYNDCLEKNGESVYDDRGNWRCLFPNSAIPVKLLDFKDHHFPNEILTKDDFQKAVESTGGGKDGVYDLGPKGVFFKTFDDMMKWRIKGSKSEVKKNEEAVHEVPSAVHEVPAIHEVPSRKEEFSFYNGADNEAEMVTIKTEYFKDGSSTSKTIKKRRPSGSDTWVDVSEEVVENAAGQDSSNGWLWNKRN